jgi:integrase
MNMGQSMQAQASPHDRASKDDYRRQLERGPSGGIFAELRAAWHHRERLSVPRLAESSSTRYRQVYSRMIRKNSVDFGSGNSAKVVRASVGYALEQALLTAEFEGALLDAHRKLCEFRAAIGWSGPTGEFRSKGKEPVGLAQYLESRGIRVTGNRPEQKRPRAPRTRRLKALASDWQERMLAALSTEIPRAREALIFLALTGCRPSELGSGKVELDESGKIRLTVVSAKALAGIRRGAAFSQDGPAAEIMQLSTFTEEFGGLPFEHIDTKRLDNLLRRTSSRAFPELQPGICASCYRNQAASDLKKSGKSRVEIALFLGHSTTRQQKTYGSAVRGRRNSGWLPLVILPSHQVRELPASHEPFLDDDWEECESAALDDRFGSPDYDQSESY